jgi:hypothetical protein
MGIEVGRGLSVNRPFPQGFSKNTTQLPQKPVFGRFAEMTEKRGRLPPIKLLYISAMPRMPTLLLFGSVMLSSVLPAYGVRSKL